MSDKRYLLVFMD